MVQFYLDKTWTSQAGFGCKYQNCLLHCSIVVVVPVTDYESPQSSSNWARFFHFFPTQLAGRERGRESDTLFGEEGERETEEECNYSLRVSGALLLLLRTAAATAAAADREAIQPSSW